MCTVVMKAPPRRRSSASVALIVPMNGKMFCLAVNGPAIASVSPRLASWLAVLHLLLGGCQALDLSRLTEQTFFSLGSPSRAKRVGWGGASSYGGGKLPCGSVRPSLMSARHRNLGTLLIPPSRLWASKVGTALSRAETFFRRARGCLAQGLERFCSRLDLLFREQSFN